MAYSIDLRKRVIAAIDKGNSVINTAETFQVCIRAYPKIPTSLKL